MKATTKKLLCLLAVLVLALSLAVPAAAATQSDIDSWITKNANAFKSGENLPTTCPVCGAKNVTWQPREGAQSGQSTGSDKLNHIYLKADVTYPAGTANNFVRANNASVCVFLNGKNVTYSSASSIFHAGPNSVNVFGSGNVTNEGTGSMINYNGVGRVNIYGGNYVQKGSGKMFEDKALTEGQTVHAMIYGGTFSVNPETADDDYTNKDIVAIAQGCKVTKSGSTWTVSASGASKPSNPATADNSALLLWAVLAITSGAALTIASK